MLFLHFQSVLLYILHQPQSLLVHEELSEKIIDGLLLLFVELPKFNPHTYSEKRMQVLWLRFFTEIN